VALAAVLVVGCSSNAAPSAAVTPAVQLTASPAATAPPTPTSTAALVTPGPSGSLAPTPTIGGTNEPATPSPSAPPTATAALTPAPTPATTATAIPSVEPSRTPLPHNTPGPTRTLKPGETPRGTPLDIVAFLTAKLAVANLGDKALAVDVSAADDNGKDPTSLTSATLQAFDAIDQETFEGTYVITFTRPGGSAKPVTCIVKLVAGDSISFWATDTLVAVTNDKKPPTKPGDLIVGTSPICAG
jgi:hypothetical protein